MNTFKKKFTSIIKNAIIEGVKQGIAVSIASLVFYGIGTISVIIYKKIAS